jgi:putative FmdB family regulatory protein
MPIYEYRCHGCQKKVSIFQRSVNAAAAPRCPECGATELTRLISQFAFHRGMPDFDLGSGFDDESFLEGMEDNPEGWARGAAEEMGGSLPPGFDDQLAGLGGDYGGLDD